MVITTLNTSRNTSYWLAEQKLPNGRVLLSEGKTLREAISGVWSLIEQQATSYTTSITNPSPKRLPPPRQHGAGEARHEFVMQ